jgi:hypothetical protein
MKNTAKTSGWLDRAECRNKRPFDETAILGRVRPCVAQGDQPAPATLPATPPLTLEPKTTAILGRELSHFFHHTKQVQPV